MGKKAMEAIFPEKSNHLQMVILKALKDLGGKKRWTCHATEADLYLGVKFRRLVTKFSCLLKFKIIYGWREYSSKTKQKKPLLA